MTQENEALRGELLEAWLDDLSRDRPPRDHPAVHALPPDDVAEVMRLARWHKGVFFPSHPTAEQAPTSADELLPEVTDMDLQRSLRLDGAKPPGVFADPHYLTRIGNQSGVSFTAPGLPWAR